jgi:hypothetical protein
MKRSTTCFLATLGLVTAQNATGRAPSTVMPVPPSSTSLNGSPVSNPTAFVSPIPLNVDQLWDLFVGPVSTATVNTTVAATPVPTNELIPPPGLYYSSFPSGQQVPLVTKNESWSFPKGFWWGVASAAYQAEGAVKAEGRGPSIWDVLTHRAVGYTIANQTGDIADNQYYLYKQGQQPSVGSLFHGYLLDA